MEVNFVKKNRDGKTYRVDMAQLPERCCVDALPATAILWFRVATREESAANPGEDNVTVRNVYGETLRTDKKTLTRCVRRLSGNKLMMATIESGKEYNGVYVGCNLTKEEKALKSGEQGGQQLAVEIFAEFMTFEDNKALTVFVCPKNCKPFYNGKSYPSGCYYVMISDENKGTPFTIYKPNKFKKLFYIGEQEKLKDLHELSKSGVFKIERLDKALENFKHRRELEQANNHVASFEEYDDTREAKKETEHKFERKRRAIDTAVRSTSQARTAKTIDNMKNKNGNGGAGINIKKPVSEKAPDLSGMDADFDKMLDDLF